MGLKYLKAKMILKGVTGKRMMDLLNISKPAYYRKINGSSEFRLGEIKLIKKELGLSNDEVWDIFFS